MPDAAADILFLRKMHPLVETSLNGRHTVHRLAGASDPEAMLDAVGPRIRGLCVGGQVSIDGALMDRFPKLEIIANFGVGYDAVDAAAAHRRGIIVTNTPDVLTDEVADLAIGLVLATLRRLPQADRYLREGHWPKAPFPLTGLAARAARRDPGARPDRACHRPPARELRRRDRLSRSPPAAGRSFRLPRQPDRPRAGGPRPDRSGTRRPRHTGCRGRGRAEGPRPRGYPGQRCPREPR